jgi:hypothetical protein
MFRGIGLLQGDQTTAPVGSMASSKLYAAEVGPAKAVIGGDLIATCLKVNGGIPRTTPEFQCLHPEK